MTEAISPVGVALLGAAHTPHAWSYSRALSTSPLTTLVGVHDDDPTLAQSIRRDFEAAYYADPEELLSSPDVQAAVVCSPTVMHRQDVELAASMGKHVMCEKPLATAREDAQAMIDACARAGVVLEVAFVSRFHPMVVRARDVVRSGRLGGVVGMVGGNRGRPPLPPTYPAWITSKDEAGGGALIDHSVHVTDAMRHVSGLEATTVSAEVDALLWGCGVDDVALLLLEFEGGAVASVDPSWSVPADNPWDYDFFLRVLGTDGSLDIRDSADSLNVVSTVSVVGGDGPRGLRQVSFGEDVDLLMIEAFARSVRAGRVLDPCATGEDGLRALEIALAGYQSASRHHPISVSRSQGPTSAGS
jgi:predicted dehydrogenase